MDFTLDTEQVALRDAVRGILGGSAANREKVVATEPGWDRDVWGRLAEMGLLGLPFDEAYDGAGAGAVEVGIVAQEIGRVLAPEPFIDVVVGAGELIADAGTEEQKQELLPKIAAGDLVAVIAHQEPRAPHGTVAYGVTATPSVDGWTLDGVKEPVRHGGVADVLVVSAKDGETTRLFVVDAHADGVTRTTYATPDDSYAARVVLTGAVATPLGEAGEDALARAFARLQTAYGAEAIGAMEISVETTVGYLKTRKQFGVTLSKFQALTFRAADMYTSLELARSVSLWATMSLAEHGPDPLVASRLQAEIGRTARHVSQESIQLHGGIGVTAEYSIGHYAARLTVLERTLGTEAYHLGRVAEGIDGRGIVELLR
ncbi:acyl-CoA dehydrogenase family protein [Mumia sp. zg.B17]|uniref:acyl-CoA dehydrogenase family protein n=1 Tax=Mumia sp. zg.B17 TaxID=2855446 RepID=UPI001C6F2375|nr:acyl-CoA dehydrogenase family protein [Mumia sp. zg.B17]MBW9207626.1 acyl-CoA dehydrogenase family protein [Mumia sp. zg.B17]